MADPNTESPPSVVAAGQPTPAGSITESAPPTEPTETPTPETSVPPPEAGASQEPAAEAVHPPAEQQPAPAKPSLLAEAAANAPKEEPKAAEPDTAPPSYEFTLPEGARVDAEAMGTLRSVLGEAKVTQEAGQKLVDLHIQEINRLQEQMAAHQREAFDNTRATWREEFESDPEYGGNLRQTTLNSVIGFIRHYAKDDDHFNRLIQAGEVTGWNDNPDFIRLIANAARGLGRLYREPEQVVSGNPVPPAPTSRYARRYNSAARG